MKARKTTADFLTVDGAARLVGVTHWTIRRWLQVSKLTRYKSGQLTFVDREELLAVIAPKPKKTTNKMNLSPRGFIVGTLQGQRNQGRARIAHAKKRAHIS
jgi:excisionase family DNA binding protein